MNKEEMTHKNLISYGFRKEEDRYTLTRPLLEDQFTLTVTATRGGVLQTDLKDNSTGEDYVLYKINDLSGSFIGEVREAVNSVLEEIRESCFGLRNDSVQTEKVIAYIKDQFSEPVEYLWKKTPESGIVRRKDNRKWYIVITEVEGNKIGLDTNKKVPIIDLRAKSGTASTIVDHVTIFPGWHMNKKNWYTLVLDGRTEDKELYERIAQSREFVATKKARSKK